MEQERTGFDLTLKKLTINNFRGFGHLEVPFDKDTIVFIAENGGGKTTILDAIAECLKVFMWQLLKRPFTNAPNLSNKNIKTGTSALNANLEINFSYLFKDKVLVDIDGNVVTEEQAKELNIVVRQDEIDEKIENDYSIYLNLTDGKLTSNINGYETSKESEFDFKVNFDKKITKDYCPLLLYYGCNSVNTTADTTNDVKEDEIYHIYYGGLEPTRFSFQSFFQWFDTEFKISHIPEKKPNKSLEIVCNAIEQMFNDDMKDKMYKDLRMNYQLKGNDMIIDKKNAEGKFDKDSWIDVTQMSAGEKMIFAMVADISKRLILANPRKNDDVDDKNQFELDNINPLHGRGIVLIDEIDLHLHPKWQRKVLVKLKEIFPNLQFIVTTHSPFVVQSTPRNNCIELINQHLRQRRDIIEK